MAEIGNVTVRVDAVITDEQYREAMGAVIAANECMDLLVAENAKLHHDLEEANNQAEEVCIENAKLRELVRDYEHCTMYADCSKCEYDGKMSTHCPLSPCFPDADELRELGVEVDE